MKAFIAPVALIAAAMSSPAQADTLFLFNEVGYCQEIAGLGVTYAEDRENGRTLESIQGAIAQELADGDLSEGVAWDAQWVAEYVYHFPRQSPSAEGNDLYALCRE